MDNMVEPALHYNLWIDLIFNPQFAISAAGVSDLNQNKKVLSKCVVRTATAAQR